MLKIHILQLVRTCMKTEVISDLHKLKSIKKDKFQIGAWEIFFLEYIIKSKTVLHKIIANLHRYRDNAPYPKKKKCKLTGMEHSAWCWKIDIFQYTKCNTNNWLTQHNTVYKEINKTIHKINTITVLILLSYQLYVLYWTSK